jgi:hypothetical protein
MGQAAGTAAAFCARDGLTPRQFASDDGRVSELQQALLRDDQTIKGLKNEDPRDLARKATITASASADGSRPENVVDGLVRDPDDAMEHRWAAPLSGGKAWVELSWPEPQSIRHVQLTFDTGFQRELTLTSSDSHNAKMIRAPQPETVRDYAIRVRTDDGRDVEVARVTGNHQRLRRHDFAPVLARSVRLEVTATNGSDLARVYEVRCYG